MGKLGFSQVNTKCDTDLAVLQNKWMLSCSFFITSFPERCYKRVKNLKTVTQTSQHLDAHLLYLTEVNVMEQNQCLQNINQTT